MNKKSLTVGVIAGVAIGTCIGMFMNSEKGTALRRKLSRPHIAYSDELEEKFDELIDKVTEDFNKLVLEVTQMAESRKSKV